jgi:sulfite exporter TauE/SafE
MAQSALIAAFLVGLAGGLHCAAMCGGFITALAARPARAAALEPARSLVVANAAAQAGRIATYVALGAALGGAGGAAFAVAWEPLQRGLYVAANLALLALAYGLWRDARGGAWFESAGLALFRRVAPAMQRHVTGRGIVSRFLLGLLWGLTPCALVYGVLPVALLSGGAWNGAAVMLAFGAGTLPNVLAAGYALARVRAARPGARWRVAASVLVAAFAVAGLYRAVFVPAALGAGPFCLVPP